MRAGIIIGAAVLLAAAAGPTQAVVIPASAIATPTDRLVNGLDGRFADIAGVTSGADVSNGLNQANNNPDATFTALLLDYPNGAANTVTDTTTTLSAFLGVNATDLQGATSSTLEGSMFVFDGFIEIDASFDTDPADSDIDVNFAIASDDGFQLFIGGQLVTQFFGNRAFGVSSGLAEFESAGLYSFTLNYWENGGVTGIEAYSSIPGGPDSGAPAGTVGIIPTAVLFRVSEPATILLLALGAAGLCVRRRRA